MTNAEVLSLKPGDRAIMTCNGHEMTYTIREITARGTCDNSRSGANGHAYACFRGEMGTIRDVATSLHSDEYSRGEGYPTHDRDGRRIRGWELSR